MDLDTDEMEGAPTRSVDLGHDDHEGESEDGDDDLATRIRKRKPAAKKAES